MLRLFRLLELVLLRARLLLMLESEGDDGKRFDAVMAYTGLG
jgi:hypothetical protein